MSLQDLSAYLVGLFRNGPEVCAAFVVGIIASMLLLTSLRRWFSQDQDLRQELVRKELELTRKEAELARKDEQLRKHIRSQVEMGLSLEVIPPYPSLYDKCTQLERENRQLQEEAAELQQRLATTSAELSRARRQVEQLSEELAHAMKWLDRTHEENAHLAEKTT